jgi:hypothetical protein
MRCAQFFDEPRTALEEAVMITDEKFLSAAQDLSLKTSSGSCAIIAYIEGNHLYVANLGGLRANCRLTCNTHSLTSSLSPSRNHQTRAPCCVSGGARWTCRGTTSQRCPWKSSA